MNDSIFTVKSLDRNVIKWEDHLATHTPWENHRGIWFKREDYFAPLGYGGPNGSKMRQLVWYVNKFRAGKSHIVTGASIQSPQLSMSAIVGQHYGLPARQIVYSKPDTILRHENPNIAHGFGAEFEYASGPYNPILQRKVVDLTQPDSLIVEYGITVPHDRYDPEIVRKFHEVGANQLNNIPEEVTRLIVPAGSCNSLTSVMLGLLRDQKNVKELFTIGIGPNKLPWMRERLQYIGLNVDDLPFKWDHFSLHDTGFSKYSDHFTGESFDGIRFHPTYEAKMWRWLTTNDKLEYDDHTAFWIVGSAPQIKVIEPFYTRTNHEN